MKTRFIRYSACLLLLLAASAPNLLNAQGSGPDFSRLPQIRVQSPLLSVGTKDAAATGKDDAKPAEPVKPAESPKPAADPKPRVKMKEPAEDIPSKGNAVGGGSPVLLPAKNAPQPKALTPDNPNLKPLPPASEEADASGGLLDPNAVFIPKLKGIHLFKDDRKDVTGKPSQVPSSSPAGITLGEGLTTPAADGLTSLLRSRYLGKGVSFNTLDKIVKDILEHYSKEQRPTTHVYIPEQEIGDTLKVAVLEGRLGDIRFAGEEKSRWYHAPAPRVPRALEKQRGEILDMNTIGESVSSLNISPWARLGRQDAHPYRSASVSLTPGAELGLTDVELTLQSRQILPIQAFTGWDNTGTVVLGENRFNVGFVWYDAFNTGYNHQLGFQAQTAENFDLFHALIGSYQIPLPSLNSTIQLYGAFMQSAVNIPTAGVNQLVEGDAWILGGRLFYKLPDWLITEAAKRARDRSREFALYHEVGIGFDYKSQSNDLFFGGVNVFPTQIEVAQYVVEYNLRQTDKWGETTASLAYFYAPGSITRNNTDADFLAARTGGTADYSYFRGNFSRMVDLGAFTKHLNDIKFVVRGTGQWSTANLVASEQLGLGGQDSVRGYPERTMRGDRGIFIQSELYSPALHPLRWLAKKTPDRWSGADDRTDELRFLVFYDYGWADVFKPTAAEPGEILNASSIGIGLRYRFNKSMTFRLDYGYQLEKLDRNLVNAADLSPKYSTQGDSYTHMGLSLSF